MSSGDKKMSKLTNLVYFITVAIVMCHFGGLLGNTPIGYTLTLLMNPYLLKTSAWYQLTATALSLGTLSGAIIGLFSPERASFILKASIVSGLLLIGWDLIALWNLVGAVNKFVATVLIAPMLLVYVIVAVEWWR